MAYVTWSFDTLETFCTDVFKAFGFNESEGKRITDVLLKADLYGTDTNRWPHQPNYASLAQMMEDDLFYRLPRRILTTQALPSLPEHRGSGTRTLLKRASMIARSSFSGAYLRSQIGQTCRPSGTISPHITQRSSIGHPPSCSSWSGNGMIGA